MVRNTCTIIFLLFCLLLGGAEANAFDTDVYAAQSRLASGQWHKISVSETGVHFISREQLSSWGLKNVDKVVVAGYGAAKVPDLLSPDTYVDDLPEVPCLRTADGLYFYGVGPEMTETDINGHITSSLNPYTAKGYYFISEGEPAAAIPVEGRAEVVPFAQTTFMSMLGHETDRVSYGNTGMRFFGEDFRFTPRHSFSFELTDKVDGTPVWIKCNVAARVSGKSEFSLKVGGTAPAGSSVELPAVSGANYGVGGSIEVNINTDLSTLPVELTFAALGSVSAANLDAIFVNYTRNIALDRGTAMFNASSTAVRLARADASAIVWDVTDPLAVKRMNTVESDGGVAWVNDYTGVRKYAAWSAQAKLPSPVYEKTVTNSNLHAMDVPDMVIVTLPALIEQANRIARIHENIDGMTVAVVQQSHIFNEFSSGAPDFGAFRRFFKMLYDRSVATGNRFKYALMFGRATFDIRGITPTGAVWSDPVMPSWQSAESLIETASYTTDDYLAFLEDNSGLRPGADTYSIAIGRIPAGNAADAKAYVDKLEKYIGGSASGDWHNRVIMTADDGDMGIHMTQADELIEAMCANPGGKAMVYDKVYIDAYPLVGGVCEQGRSLLHRLLDAGAAWWTYTGHANKYYLSAQGIMTLNDINSLSNRKLPVFFGATCYFMQWDGFEQSGAEKMFFRPNAGVIAAISATRPVYISENSLLSRALGRFVFARDRDSGKPLTLGEMLQGAKNSLGAMAGTSNTNKLRYALMGDPALRVATGDYTASLTELNGVDVSQAVDSDIVLSGRENVTLKGYIADSHGELQSDFNGTVSVTLYDAEKSVTTQGRNIDGTMGRQVVYEEHGERLYAGRDTVAGGQFSMNISMPAELADNYRNALISINATDETRHATGTFYDFYVYGSDETALPDTVPPVIETFYMNHPTFVSGDKINESPMVIASVSDNIAINMSTAGIGRAMSLKLDGVQSIAGVSDYYTPFSDGTPGGTIALPLSGLQHGAHELTLRVYDTSGNYAEATISFTVDPSALPEIYEVYTDVNPASVEANFYISHNRPDELLTVTMSVYNLMGSLVWSKTVTDRNMFTSAPITWNLHDLGGHRVVRGIYIYKAEISANGQRRLSKGRRIAVTGK